MVFQLIQNQLKNKNKLKIVLAHYEHTLGSKTPFWFSFNFKVMYLSA
tara:strand:+ start:772 stop:912 length:141 start_codon:yes stop_codon:yes gene_type:complete